MSYLYLLLGIGFFYLLILIFSLLYCKYGKSAMLKDHLKSDVAGLAVFCIVVSYIASLLVWVKYYFFQLLI